MNQALADAYALLKTGTLWHNTQLSSPKHPCKGFADANPGEASEIDTYVGGLVAGSFPSVPTLATATGKGLVGMLAALAPTAVPAPPPPPAPTGKLWGISPSNNGGFNPAIDTQMAEYVAIGVNCPRIPESAAASARAHGFKQFVVWVSGDGSATVDSIVAVARQYPEAMVGFGNELNLNGAWTAAAVAAKQIAVYNAVKAAGVPNKVVLSSVGNSASSAEHLLPLDWCKHLAAAGCKYGTGFDIADYHMYDADPQHYDNWMHVWTPAADGTSCQSVLGHPPFIVSEMGAKIGVSVPDATAQATAVKAWVAKLASLPECLGGMWFQCFDGTAWTGYGLIDGAGNHRPSYDAFKAAIA